MGLTERQARAALDHTRSKCVTAGAGTGKTHVLVRKYISLLEEGASVGSILALTFTEKAAAEMKVRVRQALAEKEGKAWDAVRDEFLWAKVSTFHAFCAAVLREFPLEANVGPSFAVLDEREAALLRDEAMDDLIYGDPPAKDREAVIGALRAVGAYELKNYLIALSRHRDDAEAFFAALAENEEAVLDAWRAIVEEEREKASLAFRDRAGPSIEVLEGLAARYPGKRDPAEAYLRAVERHLSGTVDALIEIHRGSGLRANMGQRKNWAGDDLNRLREAYVALKGCIEDNEAALSLALDPDDPFTRATLAFLHDLSKVFHAFIRVVEAEKRRRNALDFDDLVNRTRRLLVDHEEIAAHFRNRFRFILIDEFQDTDPVQIAIIHAILGREPGTLFIVGDPKQSIYLFREADVAQFRHTRDMIERDFGGETIALDVNFRSAPSVVEFTNAIFGALMAECGRPWEFLYEPLAPNRSDGAGSVEILLPQKVRDRAAGRRAEADMAAKKIRAIVERGEKSVWRDGESRPAGYGDIAILLERRTNLAYYEWALARYGIPYRVHAGLGFYERQELYDIYNILRFLVNDRDDVALYGALRSPYFGFSDARLFAIAGTSFWERLQRSGDPDAIAAATTLRGWLSVARRLPPARLIRRVIDESGITVIFGGTAGGEQAVANIEKLIAIARASSVTLADLVEELGRSIDDGEREGDAPLDLTSSDAVSIMTVHAAKGLEFPVVVVPDLAETPRAGGATIMVEGGLRLGVRIPNPAHDYEREDTPILQVLKAEYRQKEEAERKRLFYVAATRARDHLVLCGVRPDEAPETLAAGKTRMAWLAHCLGLSPEAYARGETILEALRIPLTLDPASIPVDVGEAAPVCITVPDGIPAVAPAGILPRGTEEHVYSVSEIERYIRDPAASRMPRFSTIPGPVTHGLAVHEVFRGREPAAVLSRYGMDVGRAEEYRDLYERFLASPLMQGRIDDRCEVPFVARVNGVMFEGSIDRLVRRPDGSWVLIDYKTGDAGEYAIQMTVYRHAAEQILGRPATPYLYFVDADRWVEVAVDEEQAFAAIERAVRGIEEGSF
ncbi:MAG TPA: UvrD-helicase domain-containing protein [Methanoculleus sp.]|uniref:UvrD-helicase domain-containing protein n=1 Tax=Methanoculleus sp. TaxID=90427 RepID=UPI002D0FFA24|nr:UvrD-helicase domain-containing protein [Methanoculleus sp.]HQL60097.1 UvrD-helicase domain-containing protein [Methanoculleus sp.]